MHQGSNGMLHFTYSGEMFFFFYYPEEHDFEPSMAAF
jgi:hypothetical protein